MKTIPIVIVGKGNVGRALLGQMVAAREKLKMKGLDLRVVGVAGRKAGAFVQQGLSDESLQAIVSETAPIESLPSACPIEGWEDLHERILAAGFEEQIIVDATAEQAEQAHLAWLRSGWHVVTANKKPVTASGDSYDALMAAAGQVDGPRYRYEACCGAGLPVVSTLSDLLGSGDEIIEVRAAVSGTLGFIFAACEEGRPFAAAVVEAKVKGFTEPDPRDDLSGVDVARKALILARLAGWRLELTDIPVENLVPPVLAGGTVEQFMAGLEAASAPLSVRFAEAAGRGKALRYLMTVGKDGVRVGIEETDRGVGFGSLRGPENMFVMRTKRYDDVPLTIRGPGAGTEVTAAGVFSDILRIAGL